jgi:hypothetical protein
MTAAAGDSTETLAMCIHKTTLDFLDFGYGSRWRSCSCSRWRDVRLPQVHAPQPRQGGD